MTEPTMRERVARAGAVTYPYSAVACALVELHGGSGAAALRISARIKHFIHLGFTPDSPGRGRRISYTFEDVAKWALALEVAQFGMDPTVFTRFVSEAWSMVRPEALTSQRGLLVFEPATLSAPDEWSATACVTDQAGFYMLVSRGVRRLAMIDVAALYMGLAKGLAGRGTSLSGSP